MREEIVRQPHPLKFFSLLRWIDGRWLVDVIEPYRQRIFEQALYSLDEDGRPRYNLVLAGRAKKNWKSADLILVGLFRLLAWKSTSGNQCYCLANDLDQAKDDLELAKKIIKANRILASAVTVKQRIIERKDGQGFLEILPAQDIAGTHGKSYLFVGYDEIHSYKSWDILEALQPDPHRPDALQWITSYASIYHKPGIPLFDIFVAGKKAEDPKMYFSWYAADYSTDPDFENASPEDKANPSRNSWQDPNYLEQQQRRLPAHKYRRLHLNLPGLPAGSAFDSEMVMNAVERGVKVRSPQERVQYVGFVDMSGGSNDDSTLAIGHREGGDGDEGQFVLDVVMDQGQRPPFDPRRAVERFAKVLKEYRCFSVVGDKYAGETFINDFQNHGVAYTVSTLTKSEIYAAMEAPLNSGRVVLLDAPKLESQMLSLVWRANKIDHANGEHDDFINSVAGAIHCVLHGGGSRFLWAGGRSAVADDPDSPWRISPRRGTISDW